MNGEAISFYPNPFRDIGYGDKELESFILPMLVNDDMILKARAELDDEANLEIKPQINELVEMLISHKGMIFVVEQHEAAA